MTDRLTFPVLLDGYTDLPAGKIANVVTFLERTEPPGGPASARPDLTVVERKRPAAEWYRNLYRRIGENWLWFSRAVMPDAELSDDPRLAGHLPESAAPHVPLLQKRLPNRE